MSDYGVPSTYILLDVDPGLPMLELYNLHPKGEPNEYEYDAEDQHP